MRTCVTVELDDRCRRALRLHRGQSGLATRAEVVLWVEALVSATIAEIASEMPEEKKT